MTDDDLTGDSWAPPSDMAANVPSGPYESIVVATPVLKARRVRRGVVGCVVVLAMIVALSFVLKPKDPESFSLKASVATTQNVERLRFEVDDLAFGGDIGLCERRAATRCTCIAAIKELRTTVGALVGD